jgi:hypothetical protein
LRGLFLGKSGESMARNAAANAPLSEATLLILQRYISSGVRCFWREIRAARLRCW